MNQQARHGFAVLAIAWPLIVSAAEPAKAIGNGLQDAEQDAFQVGGGLFDVQDDDRVPAFGVEYRSGSTFAYVAPAIGALVNADYGVYGYLGIRLDLAMGPFSIMPGLAAGYYHRGDSKDLGGPFAFRQSIGVSYRLAGGLRLGLLFAHISNAGIYDDNPGQEDAQLILAMSVGSLFD